ncbi:hypothetical protein [Ralstonia sp. TCR112]|uniref:hypothetical protein n=1 Tax=Ralstonia sp. TCR112 TaxID=2601730 RepID=UPI001C9B8740|nr:hypothetical protein [Ralstonia sp. TCR112]
MSGFYHGPVFFDRCASARAVPNTPQSVRRRHIGLVRERDSQQGLHRRRATKRRSKNNNHGGVRAG